MKPPLRVRLFIGAVGVLGATSIVVAALVGGHDAFSRPGVFAAFTGALAISWAFPLLLLHGEETEAFQLDEAFFVALGLLLSPVEVVLAFAIGVSLGRLLMRRGLFKAVFNVGQSTLAAGTGILVSHAISPMDGPMGISDLAAIVAGAMAFFAVQSAAVSTVIALAEDRSFKAVFSDGMQVRLLVWGGNVSVGLLTGLVGYTYPWALAFAAVPAVVIHLAFVGHLQARRDRERMNGLFETAVKAHASMGIADVEKAIAGAAKSLLRCAQARFDTAPAQEDELGARIGTNRMSRWLIVSDRRGVEPFDHADRSLLEAIVAIGAAALDNAGLYKQARDEKRKLADVVDSSSDGIFALDADERITLWSPAMEEICGHRADEMVGTKHLASLRPRDSEGKDVMTDGWTATGRFPSPSIQITTRTGEVRWLSCTFSSLPDGGCVVVARDVTAEWEADELKSDFLGTVSHELRTPLTPIQGFLQTLLRGEKSFTEAERTHFYEIMLAQSERLGRLVEQILDAVSIQERRRAFVPEPLDWESSALGVVELMRHQHPERTFFLEVASGLPMAFADDQRMEQVLSNLLSNSVKYAFPNFPIRVAIRSEGGEILTTVRDRGPGISQADRDRVFERFTRLGSHLTRKAGGVGLGLYISRKLVEGMNGHIWVEDAPEGGASFTFAVPAHAGPRLHVVTERTA